VLFIGFITALLWVCSPSYLVKRVTLGLWCGIIFRLFAVTGFIWNEYPESQPGASVFNMSVMFIIWPCHYSRM